MAEKVILQLNYRRTVPAVTGMRLTRRAPATGIVKSILVHFPAGCVALVLIRFGIETLGRGQVFPSPSEQYVALDDATKEFPLREYVEEGDAMWVEILNGDAVNPHTPSVVVELERQS